MTYTLLVGGARSGKSALAERMATESGAPVVVVATAVPEDAEMAARIALHRHARPASWRTIEEPTDVAAAIAEVAADTFVILDCLTLWVSNLVAAELDDVAVLRRAREVAGLLADRSGSAAVVSNEVGSGIVPVNDLARRYRDLLGRVNIEFAARADRTLLVVAGRTLELR